MNKQKQPLLIPQGVTVEESRLLRQQQQQARFRNRGGTFVPAERNKVLELLMARTITGESPTKGRRPRASIGRSTLKRRSSMMGTSTALSTKRSKKKTSDAAMIEEDADAPDLDVVSSPVKKKKGKAKAKSKAKPKSRTTKSSASVEKSAPSEETSAGANNEDLKKIDEEKEEADWSEEEAEPVKKPRRTAKEAKKPRKKAADSAKPQPPQSDGGEKLSDQSRSSKRKAPSTITRAETKCAEEISDEDELPVQKKRRKAADASKHDVLPAVAKVKAAASKQKPQPKANKSSTSQISKEEGSKLKRSRAGDDSQREAKRRKSPCSSPPDSPSSPVLLKVKSKKTKPAADRLKGKDEEEVENLLFTAGCDETLTIGPDALEAIKQLAKAPKIEKAISKTRNLKENAKGRPGPTGVSKPASKSGQGKDKLQRGIPDAVMARLKKLAGAQHVCDEEPDPLDCLS